MKEEEEREEGERKAYRRMEEEEEKDARRKERTVSNWFNVWKEWLFDLASIRDRAMASISSMKMMHGAFSLAVAEREVKRPLRFRSATVTKL
jgi:hypothetical protein